MGRSSQARSPNPKGPPSLSLTPAPGALEVVSALFPDKLLTGCSEAGASPKLPPRFTFRKTWAQRGQSLALGPQEPLPLCSL